jgi:hypothetical protein
MGIHIKKKDRKNLVRIHNRVIRLAIGIYRSSPIPSMLKLAGILPLKIRISMQDLFQNSN